MHVNYSTQDTQDDWYRAIGQSAGSTTHTLRKVSPQEVANSREFRRQWSDFPDTLKQHLTSEDLDLLERARRREDSMRYAFTMDLVPKDHSYISSTEYEFVVRRCLDRAKLEKK